MTKYVTVKQGKLIPPEMVGATGIVEYERNGLLLVVFDKDYYADRKAKNYPLKGICRVVLKDDEVTPADPVKLELTMNETQVADRVGINVRTLRRWMDSGKVPGRNVGNRWSVEIVEKWLKGID